MLSSVQIEGAVRTVSDAKLFGNHLGYGQTENGPASVGSVRIKNIGKSSEFLFDFW